MESIWAVSPNLGYPTNSDQPTIRYLDVEPELYTQEDFRRLQSDVNPQHLRSWTHKITVTCSIRPSVLLTLPGAAGVPILRVP